MSGLLTIDNIAKLFIFLTGMILFILLSFSNYDLYRKYKHGYLNIKHSKIIEALLNLFFWKTVMFLILAILALVQIISDQRIGVIMRLISLPVFGMVLYWLNEFGYWSVKQEDTPKKKKKVITYNPRGW